MEHDTPPEPFAEREERAGGAMPPERSMPITPDTEVRMKLPRLVALIVGVATLVAGGLGGYYALASTTSKLDNRVQVVERTAVEHGQKLARTPTTRELKRELGALRLGVRMDILNAVWTCSRGTRGDLSCRPRLSADYQAAHEDAEN